MQNDAGLLVVRAVQSAVIVLFAGLTSGCSGGRVDDGPAEDGGSGSSAAGGSGGGSGIASGGTGSLGGAGAGDGSSCDTADVRAIFLSSCSSGFCHDATAPAADLDLTVFDPGVAMSGVSGTLCSDALLVDPGSPGTSLLYTKVSEQTPSCGERMPIGSALGTASIDCIASWITALGTEPPSCETCGAATCTDLLVDTENCGTCGTVCSQGQICEGGVCAGCPDGQTGCGTACVDLLTSLEHCGACGTTCGAGQACSEGECVCDTGASVSFAQDVAPLLADGCTAMGCHAGAKPKEDLDLRVAASYGDLVGVSASQCPDGRLLVDPGAPEASYLLQKMLGVDLCSGTLMPKADAPLAEADLATITAWICAGAPDN